MIVKSIGFFHPFHVTQFLIPKAWVEIELQEGDSIEEARSRALEEALKSEAEYRKTIGMSVTFEHIEGYKFEEITHEIPKVVQIEKPETEESRIAAIETDILSCQEMKVLESYKLIVKKNPGLLLAYQKMEQQLSKATV